MNEPHDPNRTIDVPSTPGDSLEAGLAAGFARPSPPRSSLGPSQRPLLLKEAQGESDHVVKPRTDAMPPKEQTGDRYRLDGEIARGGMGAVLRGRDVDLGRDLAVKVLLEKHAHRPEVVRRFIEEAQIGGQLQHPGVVPVYDIGRFGERPFFTMKLVKGHTLAALLAERADPASDRPRFLAIALQVAQALAYAHAKGVIHRDLKPANIMVGAFGEVQVMDWGLAKVLHEGGIADEERASRTHHQEEGTLIRTARSSGSSGSFGTDTEAGSLLGTPAYMPPEQAIGDVANLDRRADVFGLGAILCEILTGKPPYVGRSSEEVRRKAANGDLADATARLDACGADSELIALTKGCLAAEAIDRPKDAQAVADGLSAYQSGVQERLHQAELARAAEGARAEEAQATAAQERKAREEAQSRAVAERRARRVTLALAATVLLALTLGGGGFLWVKADRDARLAQTTREVNAALNQAMALREKAKSAATGGAALFAQAREQASRALALVESGPADDHLKKQVRALQAELDQEEKDRNLLAAFDQAQLAQAETLSSHRFAGERAVPLFQEAFRAYGLPVGEGEPKAAAGRIQQRPAAVQAAIVAALDEWSDLTGDPKQGEWLRAVRDAAEPQDAWARQMRAAAREPNAAKRRAALEKLAASADVGKVAPRALTRLARLLGPEREVALLRRAQARYPADFWINQFLGVAYQERLKPPQAHEAVRFMSVAVALRPDSAGTRLNLANALSRTGQLDEAIACFKKAIELNPKYANAYNGVGSVLLDHKKDPDGAISWFRKAIALDPMDAQFHVHLGNALDDKGKSEEAIASYKKAIELAPRNAAAHHNLAVVLSRKGQKDQAIVHYRKSIEFAPEVAEGHAHLGIALKDKGQLDEAITCFRKAIQLDPKLAGAHSILGDALHRLGKVDEALAAFQECIRLDPKSARAHDWVAFLLINKGDASGARPFAEKAVELGPKVAQSHWNLGRARMGVGDLDGAITFFKKALELDPKHSGASTDLVQAERQAAARDRLAAFRSGSYTPTSNEERLALLGWCQIKKLHHTAAGLYAAAFAAAPKLADDLGAAHRYSAARHAALAAAGQGEDAVKLDDQERTRLRKQALDWLGADLNLRIKQLGNDLPGDPAEIRRVLQRVLKDPDLAGLRDRQAMAKWPAVEQKAFSQFWARVAGNLATALVQKGQYSEAIATFRQAIGFDPDNASAHNGLGAALASKGEWNSAIASFQKAVELDPRVAGPHANLGRALLMKGKVDEAITCCRKALDLDPKLAGAHHNLGFALNRKGKVNEAIASYQKAIELDPKHAVAHADLGFALDRAGKLGEAIDAWRRSVTLHPREPNVWYWIARAEAQRGRDDEAAAAFQKVRELYPADSPRAIEAKRFSLVSRLPALLRGEDRPADNVERVNFAHIAYVQKHYSFAARLWAEALASDPRMADDLRRWHRYSAACCAAQAAAGQGKDEPPLDDAAKAKLRGQALRWLKADLAAWNRLLATGPHRARTAIVKSLGHWQKDANLAGLRDREALAKLPADEQKGFTQLWADVASLRKKAEGKTK
jgi:serine/threonine-protein kinase